MAGYTPEMITSEDEAKFNTKMKALFKANGDRIEKVMFSTCPAGKYSVAWSALVIYSEDSKAE